MIDDGRNAKSILLLAIILFSFHGHLFCSAKKSSQAKKVSTESVLTYLVEFDKAGWPKVYIYNPKSHDKRPLDLKVIAQATLSEEKIEQALQAAEHMGTFTISNRFIIAPNGTVTLRTNPVLILRKSR